MTTETPDPAHRKAFPPHLRRLVDFCCDRHGCGHHIDGHGLGENCYVPGCPCTGWRDHTICDHRTETDPAGRLAVAEREVENLQAQIHRLTNSDNGTIVLLDAENRSLRAELNALKATTAS